MKKNLAIFLSSVLLVSTLTSCSSGSSSSSQTASGATSGTSSEPVNLTWIMANPGTVPTDNDAMEEKLNALSSDEIGVTVDILYMSSDEVQLSINAGDYYDIVFTCSWWNNYATQSNKGVFADITDKIQTVTPDLYSSIPELVWKGSKVNGKLYAVPVYKDTAGSLYWQFNKEVVVDELGLDYTKYNTFDSVEEVLEAYKTAYPDKYPINVSRFGIRALDNEFDILNSSLYIGLDYAAKDTTVVSVFDDQDYLDRLQLVHEWFNKGYINPDAPTLNDYPTELIVLNQQGYPGADAEWSDSYGFDIVSTKYYGPTLTTGSIRGAMNAVNAASNYVDESLKFMEFVNTNTTARDILAYGVEGTNFEYTSDKTQVNVLNSNYQPWIWAQASLYSMTPSAPTTAELIEELKEENDTAAAEANSQTIGFTFDITPVEAEVAACTTIFDKYMDELRTGSTDSTVEVPKMLAELESAGYRTIIAECQSQLDAYVAANS